MTDRFPTIDEIDSMILSTNRLRAYIASDRLLTQVKKALETGSLEALVEYQGSGMLVVDEKAINDFFNV